MWIWLIKLCSLIGHAKNIYTFCGLRCEERQISGSFCNSAGWILDQGIGAMLADMTMGHCAASHWSYGDVTPAGSTSSNASLNFCQPLYYLLKPKMKSFQDAWTCWSTWYFSISLNAFLNWCILPWIIERYIFKMGWSIVQIFLINSYSYNYIIPIPLFFYRKSHSRRQVQHRVRDMQDRCQSKG